MSGIGDLDPLHHARAAAIQVVELGWRRAVHPQPLAHLAHQLVGVDVARLDEQALQPMKTQVGVGDLAQTPGQPVVVGMDVGDDQVPHVGQANVERPKVAFERLQRVGGIPATIDQQVAVVGPHEIGIDVPERAIDAVAGASARRRATARRAVERASGCRAGCPGPTCWVACDTAVESQRT